MLLMKILTPVLSYFRRAAQWILLLAPSLAGAYILRLIWLRAIQGLTSNDEYRTFLDSSLQSYAETIVAAIPAILLLEDLRRRLAAAAKSHYPFSGLAFLSTLFFLLLVLHMTTGWGSPPVILLLGLLTSTTAFATGRLTRDLKGGFTRRVFFTRGTQVFSDVLVIAVSLIFSYMVRFDGLPPSQFQDQVLRVLPFVVLLYVAVNYLWGVYSFIWRLISIREALILGQSVACSALALLVARTFMQNSWAQWRVPFGVLLIHPAAVFLSMLGIRVLRRLHYRYTQSREGHSVSAKVLLKRLLLIGAGQTGARLAGELESRRDIAIMGFLDDAPHTYRRRVHGIPVHGPVKDLATWLARLNIDEVVLCMPSASVAKQRQIVAQCEAVGVRATSVPKLADIVTGKASITSRRPIRMEDLLGRDSIDSDFDDDVRRRFRRRRILVTGAAGSIGSELARQLCALQPSELILLDKDENGLYEIGLEIGEVFSGQVRSVIGDIRDQNRLTHIFERFHPEVVFHAAAYKHVPMMERDPGEAILNNVIATRHLCDIACRYDVGTFVLISSDKAVNPTSVMGASKRLAEMIVQQRRSRDCPTRFCCVRFGNVLGSRASVVPIFQKRIAQGKSLRVTHPEIRRYFMTIPEAVHLVIQAGSMGSDGEIFLLDMGDPVMIVDLARELIQLSGLVPEKDIPIEYTGLRKGEKLYEELLIDNERGDRSTKHPKIFVARSNDRHWPHLAHYVSNLEEAAHRDDHEAIYSLLQMSGIGFRGEAADQPSAALEN